AGAITGAQPRVVRGALAAGDAPLASGEFSDPHTATFAAGAPISIRLDSSAFDPYLIVRSPSGRQQDNDDFRPGALSSGIDIPAAEAGEYRILVTSYRPGETGAYTLTITSGAGATTTVTPQPGTGAPVAPAAPGVSGSRVWVLSVGISDYPGGGNDLPECANDAVKIAEALRNQGLTAPDREFLLTDAQATTGAIRSAMQRIASQIRPDDTFVFFYSGHGGQRTERSTDLRELDGVDEYLFVYDGELLDDEFGRLTDAIRARTSLIAIDACFAGGFSKDVITRPSVVGMFSSEEDVTSAVAGQFQAGGYLSHFLRLGIQGDADDDPHDRVMTVGELTHFVWLQYGRHASAVRMQMGYQHLVVDRGAVHTTQELWRSNG
ncbi:MAG: caspase family protein, partial [Myxococcota bacterium]|nr:caspase family protein [Myxococcota bacterium]